MNAQRLNVALLSLVVVTALASGSSHANEEPRLGSQYKIIRPMYLMVTYNNLNNKQISSETAGAYLHAQRYADTRYVAFQSEVAAGTVMTILSPPSKVWHLPLRVTRYLVRLEPDPSRGLDIELTLDRGIEGSLEGLNPHLFARIRSARTP
jgi:hypothetical protein